VVRSIIQNKNCKKRKRKMGEKRKKEWRKGTTRRLIKRRN
jgi:hypothetical protein